ncbi:hypothetical protein C7N83_14010, partial [Neisseria iguanae]
MARAAADILGTQPGWAMLSYRKTRQVTACHLAQAAGGVFREAPPGRTGVISAVGVKVNAGVRHLKAA